MAEYRSKYTGAEVDALLDKVESGEVGGKVTVDSVLSTESENPVMNKVITEELTELSDRTEISKVIDGEFSAIGGLNKDGSFKSTTAFVASDYIELTDDISKIEYHCYITEAFNLLCVAFYDKDKTFISGVDICLDAKRIINKADFPTNAEYVRISTLASRVPSVSYFKIYEYALIKGKVEDLIPRVGNLEQSSAQVIEKFDDILDTIEVTFSNSAYKDIAFPKVIKKGMRIESVTGTTSFYLKKKEDSSMILKTINDVPFTLEYDVIGFQTTSAENGSIVISGYLDAKVNNNNHAISKALLIPGGWGLNLPNNNEGIMHTPYIPCKKGDVIKGKFRGVAIFNANKGNIEILSGEEVVINMDNAAYCVITINEKDANIESLTINGVGIIPYILQSNEDNGYVHKAMYPYADFSLNNDAPKAINDNLALQEYATSCILGLWIKKGDASSTYNMPSFKYRQQLPEWGNTEYSSIVVVETKADGSQVRYEILEDRTSASVNDGLQIFETGDFLCYVDWRKAERGKGMTLVASEYNRLNPIILRKAHNLYLMMLSNINNSGESNAPNISKESYLAIPIPQLAMVNIVAATFPTGKTDDVHGTLEFNDMQGNAFSKKIIMNAQGTSSLGLPKKNLSIDIMDEEYDGSHEIKFGDWVSQDGFHLKAYMLDGVRVKPMACYDFYENVLLSRGTRKDRAWKRLQLPSDIPMAANDITDSYLQLDDGAKNHPSGFPIILYFNGVFHGIYCWQLKKHRKNYHQKKSKAEHIHLDGNISNDLLWEVNGQINWDKWSGKEQESETSINKEGIEIRNPKKLILTDGTEYDADTNAGELISEDSAAFDSSNADMVRTAAVRANIESLSHRVYALTQMTNGAEKKAAIAEVFDVDSIIDFIIFGQIMGNQDGYKKNWQWVTYDGIKWAVNAYDLDGTWGWTSWNYYAPYTTWIGNSTPPITLIIENYLDEIKARYKELRDNGVIDLAKIMQPLVNYVKVIGIDYYDMEFEKWTDGARDNLWRFESWMEESIKRTDALMGYNS